MKDDVPESLDAEALAKRLGVNVRTLRAWMQARALPRPPYRGHNTRYDRRLIILAHAVAALRKDGVPLAHIPRFLANKSEAQLRELGGLPPAPPPAPPPALPPPAAPQSVPPALPPEAGASSEGGAAGIVGSVVPRSESLAVQDELAEHEPPGASGVPVGAEWRRIELLPGLELHVRADASPFVHGLAAAIASGRFPK